MNRVETERRKAEAFTLSMVDLFGCGFISAVFLFFLNMLQPLIDTGNDRASLAQAGNGGDGISGPVFIRATSTVTLQVKGWPTSREAMTFNGELAAVVPDASALHWPLKLTLKVNPNAWPEAKNLTSISIIAGNRAVTTFLDQWKDKGEEVTVSFNLNEARAIKDYPDFASNLYVDLIPAKTSPGDMRSEYLVLSHQLTPAVFFWNVPLKKIEVFHNASPVALGGEKQFAKTCFMVVEKDQNAKVNCSDELAQSISQNIGSEISRSAACVMNATCWKLPQPANVAVTPPQ